MKSAPLQTLSVAESSYKDVAPMLIAVDNIIFGVDENKLQLLIFKREVEPLAGQWSLLGSFVKQHEDVDTAAKRVLFELTGITDIYVEQLHSFGNTNRDPGGRVVSIAYWSLIKVDQRQKNFQMDGHEAKWIAIDELPELVIDHKAMVDMAIKRLKDKARHYPIGIELVPVEFTIIQLLKVYEAIYNRPIDDRNFRKKLLKSGLITRLNKKDKSTSKKGSYLYTFNPTVYRELEQVGYNFDF